MTITRVKRKKFISVPIIRPNNAVREFAPLMLVTASPLFALTVPMFAPILALSSLAPPLLHFLDSSSEARGDALQFRDVELDHDGAFVNDFAGLIKNRSTRWFWSMFKSPKSNGSRIQEQNYQSLMVEDNVKGVDEKAATLMKSRFITVSNSSVSVGDIGGQRGGFGESGIIWFMVLELQRVRKQGGDNILKNEKL